MDHIKVILDKRIPFNLIQDVNGENVIFCKSFRDELFETGSFSTKDKDFVHKYITENNKKYIITDVTTPDGQTYKNVKFQVILNEKGETPFSTFNPKGEKSVADSFKLPEKRQLIVETNKAQVKPAKPLDVSESINKRKQDQEYILKAKQLEQSLIEEKARLVKERKELEEQKQIVKNERIIEEKINDYKQSLLQEFLNVSEKQEITIKEKLSINLKNFENELDEQKQLHNKDIKIVLEDINTFISKERSTLQKDFSKNIEDLKNLLEKTVNEFNERTPSLDEKIKLVQEKLDQLPKEGQMLIEAKDDILSVSKKYTDSKLKRVSEDTMSYAKRLLDLGGGGGSVAVQYANGGTMNGDLNVSNVYPNNTTGSIGSPSNRWDKIYANQIDSLSSNLVVELSGFFVDGDFTVNGTISAIGGDSNQWNSNWSTTNSNSAYWNTAYTNLVYNSTAYLSAYDMSLVNSNSGSWNTAYTNLVYNSTAYLSAYDMSLVNSNSGSWNTAYTNLVYNSANYLSGASVSYVNTNFVKLSGDIMTGGLSTVALSANDIYGASSQSVFTDGSSLAGNGTGTLTLNYINGIFTTNNMTAALFQDTLGRSSNQWNSNYTSFNSNSAKYDSNWTTTNANSATWGSGGGASTTLSSYSARWESNWTTTNNNSANWSEAYTNLVSNSANYLSGASISYVNTNFVKISGDTMTGGLSTVALSANDIYGASNQSVFTDGSSLAGNGTGTLTLNYANGIFTTNNMTAALFQDTLGRNSTQWNSNYSTTNANSARWSEAYTNLTSNSAAYLSAVNISLLAAASASWNSNYSTTNANSANWSEAYTNLVSNSAAYLSAVDISLLAAASASWNSNYTSFNSNSARYDSNWTTTNTNSANWNSAYAYTSTYPLLTALKISGIALGSAAFTNAFTVPAGRSFIATGITVIFDSGIFTNAIAGTIRLTRNNVINSVNRIIADLTIGIATYANNTLLRRSSINDNTNVAQAGETVQIAMNTLTTAYTATVITEGVLY